MLAYLDKKLNLFKDSDLHCIAWNEKAGWLAIGGSEGLLRIVDLNTFHFFSSVAQNGEDNEITHENVVMQTLEGHLGSSVTHLVWNDKYQKLASTDKHGLTIVWSIKDDDGWSQDMVNNQNNSHVTDMKWSNDGELIAIIYQSGTVIVGSVEGHKLWGLELDLTLRCVEWSASDKCIVFVTEQGCKVYDMVGNHIRDVGTSPCMGDFRSIHWNTPGRIAVYNEKGQINLVPTIYKANTIETAIETHVDEGQCSWSPDGTLLVVCGRRNLGSPEIGYKTLVVQFYDSYGKYLSKHEVSKDERIVDIEWDYHSLKVAIATERSIYIYKVRPDYTWTALHSGSTLVYKSLKSQSVYFSSQRPLRIKEKSFGHIKAIHGDDKNCVIFSLKSTKTKVITASICDEIGNVISSIELPIQPDNVSVNNRVLVVADHRNVYLNIFNSMNKKLDKSTFQSHFYQNLNGTERLFDLHDASINPAKLKSTYVVNTDEITPRITALHVTPDLILVAKENNEVVFFTYPNITRLNQVFLNSNIPKTIQSNCDFTKFSFTDEDESLYIYNTHTFSDSKITLSLIFDSSNSNLSNVWDVKWSADDPFKCCILEQGKIQELHIDDQIVQNEECLIQNDNLYLIHYSNLNIKLVNLSDLVRNLPLSPQLNIVDIATKCSKDVDESVKQENFLEAELKPSSYDRNKSLLKLFGAKFLDMQDFSRALWAFVQSGDYLSISFTEKISSNEDGFSYQEAEVMKFNGHFKQAEEKYLGSHRYDLATQMYIDAGEWNDAIRLIDMGKISGNANVNLCSTIADSLFNQRQFAKAFLYYQKAGNYDNAILSLMRCRNYTNLKSIVRGLIQSNNTSNDLIQKLTNTFINHGMYMLAIECQRKLGIEYIVERMTTLHQWEKAIYLSKENKEMTSKVLKLIEEISQKMCQRHDYLSAIEICQSTGLAAEAAENILAFHDNQTMSSKNKLLPISKKVLILAAMNVDIYKRNEIDLSQLQLRGGSKSNPSSQIAISIEKMLLKVEDTTELSPKTKKEFTKSWRNAAAYHYLQLAHEKLYEGKDMEKAMKAGIRCCEYLDILSPLTIYSLVAIASFESEHYLACSICFSKLTTMQNVDENVIKAFKKLGFAIFTKFEPGVNDKNDLSQCYIDCLEMGKRYDACLLTGTNIANKQAMQCKCCGYYMLEEEAMHSGRDTCPLCHRGCDDAEMVTILDEA